MESVDGSPEGGEHRVAYSDPELWRVHFERASLPPPDRPQLQLELEVAVGRLHERHLGVELTVAFDFGDGWLRGEVAYRVGFNLGGAVPEGELEPALRLLAAQTGPQLLYPFARETVRYATANSGCGAVSLPLVDWASELDPEEVELPRPGEVRLFAILKM